MQGRVISKVGGYLPLLRFDRTAASSALKFSGLGGRATGFRAVAGWDEDPVTLAVEAARYLDPTDRLIFASTSAPFIERAQSSLVAAALALPATIRSSDVAGSRRCAVSAVLDALLGSESTIVAAGEKRAARAGSAQHLGWGDGGAAAQITDSGTGARLIGHASHSHDFIDIYTSSDLRTPYAYEERFVRETAAGRIIAPTILAACVSAGVSPASINHAAVHEPLPGMWRDIARLVGCTAPNHADEVASKAGDLGAAHALYALAVAFAKATVGDIIVLAGFGSGCDALLFRMEGPVDGAAAAAADLARGQVLKDYIRFLSLTGTLDLDFGIRSEFEQKAQATVIERHGRDTMGFIGGRDEAGNVQFPKSRVPVRPGAGGPEQLVDVRLAEDVATLRSVTADRLNYTPDPPFWFGLMQFDSGARVLMELTDADEAGFTVGDRLAMRCRIKSLDRRRGFRTYFWKGAPIERRLLEI